MLTTPNLVAFLQARETFRPVAYDDLRPNIELDPDSEVKGTLTYGYGTTTRPDGTPLRIGDQITKQEALDRLTQYVREEIEPWIENIIHVDLTGPQYDAIGSLIYNFGGHRVAGWQLIRRINSGDAPANIAMEWLRGTWFSKGEPLLGLYRRRIMEVLMFFGLDWKPGANVSYNDDVLDVLEAVGWDGKQPKPVESPPIAKEAPVREDTYEGYSDPTPETDWTTADYNEIQRRKLAGIKPVAVSKLTKRVPVEAVDYLTEEKKAAPTVKPIENSQRGKGYAKTQTAKEIGVTGAAGTAAVAIGAAEPVVAFVDKYPATTIGWVFGSLMLFAVVYYFYGKWQRQKGEDEAEDLLG